MLEEEDFNTFYPRCFDLYDVTEFEDWVEEFKFSKVLAILKSALEIPEEEVRENQHLLELCLECGRRYGLGLKEKLKMIQSKQYPIITAEEWNQISNPKSIPKQNSTNPKSTL